MKTLPYDRKSRNTTPARLLTPTSLPGAWDTPVTAAEGVAGRIETLLANATDTMGMAYRAWILAEKHRDDIVSIRYAEYTRANGIAIGLQLALDELTGGRS